MRPFRRRSWKRKKRPDGLIDLIVRPRPAIRPITWDVFDRACRALELDPDAMLARQVNLEGLPRPPLAKGQAFLNAVLENAGDFDIRRMPIDVYETFLGQVAAAFFFTSLQTLKRAPRPSLI